MKKIIRDENSYSGIFDQHILSMARALKIEKAAQQQKCDLHTARKSGFFRKVLRTENSVTSD